MRRYCRTAALFASMGIVWMPLAGTAAAPALAQGGGRQRPLLERTAGIALARFGSPVKQQKTRTTVSTTTTTPAASLSANPSTITSGQSSSLTWRSTNATSCAATAPSGFSVSGTSGSKQVSPTSTTTYTITCSGSGGTSQPASAVVTVNGAEYPPLPANSVLLSRQDFESGTVGASFTANQCTAANNRIVTDPAEGKIWEAWWKSGDPPVAGHQARCEIQDKNVNGPGEYVYRYKMKVPVSQL
jgi:hypothetical protein